jgi:hypothetical protein
MRGGGGGGPMKKDEKLEGHLLTCVWYTIFS